MPPGSPTPAPPGGEGRAAATESGKTSRLTGEGTLIRSRRATIAQAPRPSVVPGAGRRRHARRGLLACALLLLALPLASREAEAAKPVVDSVLVRALDGSPLTRLVPGDTVFVDTYVSDADGFSDVKKLDWTIAFGDWWAVGSNPAMGASFRWDRAAGSWTRTNSAASWQVLPALCWADTVLTAVDPRLVRLAVATSPVARASDAGDWVVEVYLPSAQTLRLTGLDMAERITLVERSGEGRFRSGAVGARDLPLVVPATGAIHLGVASNAPWRIRGRATRFVDVPVGGQGFDVRAADSTLRWRSQAGGTVQGVLDSAASLLLDGLAPSSSDAPMAQDLVLLLNHPNNINELDYRGSLELVLEPASGSGSVPVSVPLHADVDDSAPPATSAVAEIAPTQVAAGTTGQSFTVYAWVTINPGDTGVNRVSVGLPPDFGPPRVTRVQVGFGSAAYADSSDSLAAVARLQNPITATSYVEIGFTTNTPTRAGTDGALFGVVFDDSRTAVGGIPAVPGSANFFVPGNRLDVAVVAGPLAWLDISPPAASLTTADTLRFAASGTDAHGNPVVTVPSWRVEGGIGWVDAAGLFSATAPGAGRVVAESGTIADTASVTVEPTGVAGGLRAVALPRGGGTLGPGGAAAEVLRLRIVNGSPVADTLRGVALANASAGAGTGADLDAAWSDVGLWLVPPGGGAGSPLASAGFAGGVAGFAALSIPVAVGDSIELAFRAGASLRARDGDGMRVMLLNSGGLSFATGGAASGAWPMVTAPALAVDGMTAAQIGLATLSTGITVGTLRHPVAALDVPSNGYAPDTLRRVNLIQLGDASPVTDLPRLELWADDGSGGFEEAADANLGVLQWTGDRWERTGLSLPVPVPGRRLFVTADAAETAREGAALRIALPSLPDVGLGMAGGNSGPVDVAAVVPEDVVTSIADRVTLTAVDLGGATVAPGQRDVPVLAVDLQNTCVDERVLTMLRVRNAIQGPGTLAQRDAELTRLDLRHDADGDGVLDDPGTDPVLASAVLSDGRASFTGFAWPLAAGASGRLFVTAGVSLDGAADGDRLAVSVASALDVEFAPASVLAARWPVQSPSPVAVDGMVAAQVGMGGAPGVTLGPDDGPVEALDVTVPRNGYLDDVLTGLRVTNAGSASSGDLAELRLWRDGGDGGFDAGAGDDSDLGPMARVGAEWRSPILAELVGSAGARLFVGATVAAAPGDSVTLRLRVPVNGISTESANQGPRDVAIENPDDLLLSTAPLLATLGTSIAASTLGQALQVTLTVRNRGAEPVTGVAPVLAGFEGSGTLTVTGAPSPASADLDPGGEATFTWPARADAAGDVRVVAYAQGTGAGSGLPRRSLFSRSNQHRIFVGAADVSMFAVQSMPFAVDRGQSGVVPLSLTFEHPGAADASDIRVDAIALRLERQSGADVAPASLLARVALVEGATVYLERTALETTGGTMTLNLARPVRVSPGNPVTVALRLDVSDTTTVPDFRVVIPDSTALAARDATSGGPVVIRLLGASYPVRSGLARVLTGARELLVDAAPETLRATRGQSLARLGVLRVRNGSDPAAGTEVRVGAVRFDLEGSDGTPRTDLHRSLSRVVARSVFGTHADRAITAADSAGVVLELASFLSVPAGATLDLELLADVRADAPLGCFAATVRDSAWIETRDASSGETIPVLLARAPLGAGALLVESPAETLIVAGRPRFPAVAGIGRPGLAALDVALRHPGSPGTSRVRVDSIAFELLDAGRQRLAPGRYLDRVVVLRGGAPIATLFDPPQTATAAAIPLPGILLEAGGRDSLELVVDVDAAAPTGTIELVVRESGWSAAEANGGARVEVAAEPGEEMPLSSGVMRLDAPARRLEAGLASRIPAALPPDGAETAFATLRLANDAAAGSGPIDVASLRIVAGGDAGAAVPLGAVAERVSAYVNGQPWIASAALTPDSASAVLGGGGALGVPAAAAVEVELRLVPRRGTAATRFRLGLDRGDIGVVQPQSSLLSIAVEAAAGSAFPFWTDYAAVVDGALSASYANFPNPFAAGREPTTFVYALERPSRVSLRIWTLRGELVRTLLDGDALGSGLRQSEQWDGRNGAGRLVANGVYVAELIVEPDGGPGERLLRKVAVVR